MAPWHVIPADHKWFTRLAVADVRDREWHYFQHVSGRDRGAGPCLYDLQADPGEKSNVIARHSQVAAELRARIADRLRQKIPEVAPGPG